MRTEMMDYVLTQVQIGDEEVIMQPQVVYAPFERCARAYAHGLAVGYNIIVKIECNGRMLDIVDGNLRRVI